MDRPDEGKVVWDNVNIVEWDDERLSNWRRQAIGFVFQTFELIPHLTALENVMVPLYPSKEIKTNQLKLEALTLLKQVGVFDTINERANRLSGGEQQRVAIARALITKPKIIFADEPTGNLDEATGKKIMELLKRQTTHDRAVVVVSHNQSLQSYADVVYEMRSGKLTKVKG